MNSKNYGDPVLNAVDLGNYTDTTATVTGGLAGIFYDVENIPDDWINTIAKKNDIIDLAHRFDRFINHPNLAF